MQSQDHCCCGGARGEDKFGSSTQKPPLLSPATTGRHYLLVDDDDDDDDNNKLSKTTTTTDRNTSRTSPVAQHHQQHLPANTISASYRHDRQIKLTSSALLRLQRSTDENVHADANHNNYQQQSSNSTQNNTQNETTSFSPPPLVFNKSLLHVHGSHVSSVGFTPDGASVLCSTIGSGTSSIESWGSDGRCVRNLTLEYSCLSGGGGGGGAAAAGFSASVGSRLSSCNTNATPTTHDISRFSAKSKHGGQTDQPRSLRALTFSPDRTRLCSAQHVGHGQDHSLKMWDAQSGKVLRSLEGHEDEVTTVAFSSDGKSLVSGGKDNTVRVWESKSGECVATLRGHQQSVTSTAMSPDGMTVVSGSDDGDVRVWSMLKAATPTVNLLRGHHSNICAVAYSPMMGELICSADRLGRIKLWSKGKGKEKGKSKDTNSTNSKVNARSCIRTLSGSDNGTPINVVAFSPDGKLLCSGGGMNGELRLWDTGSGKCIKRLLGHRGHVHHVSFSPNGRLLCSGGSGKEVRLWDVSSDEASPGGGADHDGINDVIRAALKQQDELTRQWLENMNFDDGNDNNNDVNNSNNENNDNENDSTWKNNDTPHVYRHSGRVRAVAYSPDGTLVCTADAVNTTDEDNQSRKTGMIFLHTTLTGKTTTTCVGHRSGTWSVCFSPGGSKIVSGGADRAVRLWDTTSGDLVNSYTGHLGTVTCVNFSSDGGKICSASEDESVRVWDVWSKECLLVLDGHYHEVTSVSFSPDDDRLCSSGMDGRVQLWVRFFLYCRVFIAESGSLLHTLSSHPAPRRLFLLQLCFLQFCILFFLSLYFFPFCGFAVSCI